MGIDSVILAFTSLFDADAAQGFDAVLELRLGEHRFWVRIADRSIEVGRGHADEPDAIVETDLETLRALLWQGASLAKALRAGRIRIEGDRRAVTRFVGLFPHPEPAPAEAA